MYPPILIDARVFLPVLSGSVIEWEHSLLAGLVLVVSLRVLSEPRQDARKKFLEVMGIGHSFICSWRLDDA